MVAFVVGKPTDGVRASAGPLADGSRDGGLGREELRDFVADVLPRTWAPRDVVRLEELPMLASGKVDRQRLLEGVS